MGAQCFCIASQTGSSDREYTLLNTLNGTDMQGTGAKTTANQLTCGHTAAIAHQLMQACEDQAAVCALQKRQREEVSVLVMTWALPHCQAQRECLS